MNIENSNAGKPWYIWKHNTQALVVPHDGHVMPLILTYFSLPVSGWRFHKCNTASVNGENSMSLKIKRSRLYYTYTWRQIVPVEYCHAQITETNFHFRFPWGAPTNRTWPVPMKKNIFVENKRLTSYDTWTHQQVVPAEYYQLLPPTIGFHFRFPRGASTNATRPMSKGKNRCLQK